MVGVGGGWWEWFFCWGLVSPMRANLKSFSPAPSFHWSLYSLIRCAITLDLRMQWWVARTEVILFINIFISWIFQKDGFFQFYFLYIFLWILPVFNFWVRILMMKLIIYYISHLILSKQLIWYFVSCNIWFCK